MARFVSPHRNYSHGIRSHKEARLGPDGVMIPEQTELTAQFDPDLRTAEDTALAKSKFTFRGLAIYENGQPVDPSYRISVFDTDVAMLQNNWTLADKELVEKAMREGAPNGTMYVEVVPVAADRPWNGYDDLTDASRILELAVGIDADLSKVLQYEAENENRAEVVEALEGAIASADETIIVRA